MCYTGRLFTVLAASEDTGGRFGLLETVAPKGREPSRHLHRVDDEGLCVLEGSVTFYVGREVHEAGPGAFVFLPRGGCRTPAPSKPTRCACPPSLPRAGGPLPRSALRRAGRGADAAPPPAEPPYAAFLEGMAEDPAGYYTEVVGPPARPSGGRAP